MKIALCLFGLSGGSNTERYKHNQGMHSFEYTKESIESYKKYIIDANSDCEFDIYFHTRNHDKIEELISLCKPVNYLVDQRVTDLPANVGREYNDMPKDIAKYSQLESRLKVLKLIKGDYHSVLLLRFDLLFTKPLLIKNENITDRKICIPQNFLKMYNGIQLPQRYIYNTPEHVKKSMYIQHMDPKKYDRALWQLFSYKALQDMINMTEEHFKTTESIHAFLPEYFTKRGYEISQSELSFYDTCFVRMKYGIFV